MASRYPKVDGLDSDDGDFTFLRSYDGHISSNFITDPELAADIAARRNAKTPSEADLGDR